MSNKILKNVLIMILATCTIFHNVKATELPKEAKITLDSFMYCLNNGNTCVYDYFDNSNLEMYNNVEKYLNNINVRYQIKNVILNENNTYNIKTIISAEGINWNVSGFSANFTISNINDKYIINNTTLFDVVGGENVTKFIFKIFGIVGLAMLSIMVIMGIIILFIIRQNKKKKEVVTNI